MFAACSGGGGCGGQRCCFWLPKIIWRCWFRNVGREAIMRSSNLSMRNLVLASSVLAAVTPATIAIATEVTPDRPINAGKEPQNWMTNIAPMTVSGFRRSLGSTGRTSRTQAVLGQTENTVLRFHSQLTAFRHHDVGNVGRGRKLILRIAAARRGQILRVAATREVLRIARVDARGAADGSGIRR